MNWAIITTWGPKAVDKKLIVLCFFVQLIGASNVFAKKTVGDLLKQIESEASTSKIKKGQSQLPRFGPVIGQERRDLRAVEPPRRSDLYYEEGTNEAELERVTDEGIDQLYKLTQQFKTSPRRGELWLRLAELYVEKARLIEYRLQNRYDSQLKAFQEKKTTTKPKLNLAPAQAYNKKAIQLYEWFLRDYPTDSKVPQALFFLGYNYFELGQEAKGKEYYARLTKEHPESLFVDESHFALGEYYFDRSDFKSALVHYSKITQNPRARLYSFALYKAAWSQYKTGQVKAALNSLEKVIRAGRLAKGQDDRSTGGVSRIRLAGEATKDLVVFYGEAGTPENARGYFERVVGIKNAPKLLEALAYFYADTGNRSSASQLFREMIDRDPRSPKAYDYQYQIVRLYGASVEGSLFRKELFQWIEGFGPKSSWAKANGGDQDLIKKSTDLIETTLRNYILQQHQTAQNSRAEFSQKQAQSGYELYFTVFAEGENAEEMHFFYAELLFDMKEWEKSAYHYGMAAKNPKGPYHKKSTLNAVLALEKRLPDANRLKSMVGETQEPIRFPKEIADFEKVALFYLSAYPDGESAIPVRYKLGSLYYYFNQYDRALPVFKEITDKHPGTKEAQYSANLMLDIYNIKKDFQGLEEAGKQILSKPELRASAVGGQVKGILQRSSFKRAQELESKGDFSAAAASYEQFAAENPSSDLTQSARFNAAVNYERANNIGKAIALYTLVAASKDKKDESIAKNSARFIAILQERTGQYRAAARAFEGYAQKYPDGVEFYFNAAVIFDGLKDYPAAINNYQKYFDLTKKQERLIALYLIAKVWEKRGNPRQAKQFYERYMNSNPIDPESVVDASFRIAKISEELRQLKNAEEWYRKTIAIQRRLSAKKPVGVSAAAESQFYLLVKVYDEFRRISIPANPQKQAAAVNQKLAVLERLKNETKKVIKYDDGQFIVASLTLTGQAYQHMAASLYNAPIPQGLDQEGIETYKKGIEQVAGPFKGQAIQSYREAVEKGYRLEGFGEWINVARSELSALDPKSFPPLDFFSSEIISTDFMGVGR